MQKTPFVFPILGMNIMPLSYELLLSLKYQCIGGRKVEHLEANVKALDITLSAEQITKIESVLDFDKGFPHGMVVRLFHLATILDHPY